MHNCIESLGTPTFHYDDKLIATNNYIEV